jgi:hypothetical protein
MKTFSCAWCFLPGIALANRTRYTQYRPAPLSPSVQAETLDSRASGVPRLASFLCASNEEVGDAS